MIDTFEPCREISELLARGNESGARELLIKLLDDCEQTGTPYNPLVNHLIREVGLYPYMEPETSSWQERFVFDSFKVVESAKPLHREQSAILAKLVEGKSLVVSAPTSFGKSFIIDAFISIKQPANVVIIVPTIALTDEMRRRLQRKFGSTYRFITTSDSQLGERNIFIFPQERAIQYADRVDSVDILIIDEFYKAGIEYDKQRSHVLIKAMLRFQKLAKQRYYLAPNIDNLKGSVFTEGMEFMPISFSTVFLEKHELYPAIAGDEAKKGAELVRILSVEEGKTLIYAGTYPDIRRVTNLALENFRPIASRLANDFATWLELHYDSTWSLAYLARRGFGVHNGNLHRSLSQLQIKLFEEADGLRRLISTSSIIEGVNTSAENVIVWRNRSGTRKLTDFAYRNIIGRGGRMFRHFVGHIYILDQPPASTEANLLIEFPDVLIDEAESKLIEPILTDEQKARIAAYYEEMSSLIGREGFNALRQDPDVASSDWYQVYRIAESLKKNPVRWNGLAYLNSDGVDKWDNFIYNVLAIDSGGCGVPYRQFVGFLKVLANNWSKTIPELLTDLPKYDIGIEEFFDLERYASMRLSMLFNDVNVVRRHVVGEDGTDISSFVARLSSAFLPPLVYDLEEYGLPRMLSKKIHQSGIIDLTSTISDIHETIEKLREIGMGGICEAVRDFSPFDRYILEYFFAGITSDDR